MFKVGDKVKVKLRQPIGITTEQNNSYLRHLIDRECTILFQCENPQMFCIGPSERKEGGWNGTLYVYDFELLEGIEDDNPDKST
jgi:hypothetical protein